MYVPQQYAESNIDVLHDLIRAYPLGAWVTTADGGLVANHVPFLIDASRGEYGTLVGHIARANGAWKEFYSSVDSLVIFQGAQTYITPSWYPSKEAKGTVVPTWNYAVVHAHGVPRVIQDPAWLLEHVTLLTETHEAGQATPWRVSDAPKVFIQGMLRAIVGIEIPITRLVGKWKVSQNRSDADKQGVVAGLAGLGDDGWKAMADLVDRYR